MQYSESTRLMAFAFVSYLVVKAAVGQKETCRTQEF